MARQRTLKPSFFTNEELGECSPLVRLFFAGLWCWADREGYLEDRPRKLKAEVLPYDQADGEALVAELVARGLLERLVVDGTKVLRIPTFLKHQDPHPRETPSRFAQGAPKANLGMEEQVSSPASPSCPSRPSSPSRPASPPSPPASLAPLPDWLAGIQEALGQHFGKTVSVGKDPATVMEAFSRRKDYLSATGYDDPVSVLLGDCLAVAEKSRNGTPGTLSFFVGWLNNATPKVKHA